MFFTDKNTAKTLTFELKNGADIDKVGKNAKGNLGAYEYIGRLKEDKKISYPIYKKIEKENAVISDQIFIINEWEGSEQGFKGWIGAVIFTFITKINKY